MGLANIKRWACFIRVLIVKIFQANMGVDTEVEKDLGSPSGQMSEAGRTLEKWVPLHNEQGTESAIGLEMLEVSGSRGLPCGSAWP